MYLNITPNGDSAKLQDDIDKLTKWERNWNISFHTDTIYLTISKKQKPINTAYALHGHIL